MLVEQILIFVKETLLSDYQGHDLEKPIHQITKSICHAKGITEQQMFENIQSYKIQDHCDAFILPLITAIELSAIQYGETIPLLTVEETDFHIGPQELEEGAKNLTLEEQNAVKIDSQQELATGHNIPNFLIQTDRVVAFDIPSKAQEPKVLDNLFFHLEVYQR
jgi:hypothetical protein